MMDKLPTIRAIIPEYRAMGASANHKAANKKVLILGLLKNSAKVKIPRFIKKIIKGSGQAHTWISIMGQATKTVRAKIRDQVIFPPVIL
jgi:hypothetical protein